MRGATVAFGRLNAPLATESLAALTADVRAHVDVVPINLSEAQARPIPVQPLGGR